MPTVYHFGINNDYPEGIRAFLTAQDNTNIWRQFFNHVKLYKTPARFLTSLTYDYSKLLPVPAPSHNLIQFENENRIQHISMGAPNRVGYMFGVRNTKTGIWEFFYGRNMQYKCDSTIRQGQGHLKTYLFSDVYKFPDQNGVSQRVSNWDPLPVPVINSIKEYYGNVH